MSALAAGESKIDEIGTDGKDRGEKYEIINTTDFFLYDVTGGAMWKEGYRYSLRRKKTDKKKCCVK